MSFSSISGPTPIHAPRPRPITTSVGIGTRDFGAAVSDAETQGGPPPFELLSFLQDLFLTTASSPIQRAPVTVLYPNFRQFLDAGLSALSPPSAGVTLCQGTSTRDEVEDVDVATDTGRVFSDKAVLAVVDCCDAVTAYDPPVETVPAALLPVHGDPESIETDFVPSGLRSPASTVSAVDPPDDFTVSMARWRCGLLLRRLFLHLMRI